MDRFVTVKVFRKFPGSHLLRCFGGALVLASFGASPRSFGDRLSCRFLKRRAGELRPWGQETKPWATAAPFSISKPSAIYLEGSTSILFKPILKVSVDNIINILLKMTPNIFGHFLVVKRKWIRSIVNVMNYTWGYSAVTTDFIHQLKMLLSDCKNSAGATEIHTFEMSKSFSETEYPDALPPSQRR